MRDTMYQEAMLAAVDNVESAELFSEYSVLMALGESYAKSAMMVQEAYKLAGKDAYVSGKKAEPADQRKWFQKVWDWIKRMAGKIAKFLRELPGKILKFIKNIPANLKNAATAVVAKTGMIIAEISGIGKVKYVGKSGEGDDAIAEIQNPANYEVTVEYNPGAAILVLNAILQNASDGEHLINEINAQKSAMSKVMSRTTMNLGQYLTDVKTLADVHGKLNEQATEFKKAFDDLADVNKEDKDLSKDYAAQSKTVMSLMTYLTKLDEKATRSTELMMKAFGKEQSKVFTNIGKQIGKAMKQAAKNAGAAPADAAPDAAPAEA